MVAQHPIGVFDSGYGGLTVLKEFMALLPQYDYLYLGDNARAPYGTRSFETVYEYTRACVEWFFDQGCPLVILACNTASAKALRTIQQKDLPAKYPGKRVLGVIRPTAEMIGQCSKSKAIGILATTGTVKSMSYPIEIEKFFPEVAVYQQECPLWVPLIESNEYDNAGADFFIKKYITQLLAQSADIDTILLACTHYPLIADQIRRHLPQHIQLLSQGPIVASSLADYLQRHPEIETLLTKGHPPRFCTTDETADFDLHAGMFFGASLQSELVRLKNH